MNTRDILIEKPPVLPFVVFISGVRHEAATFKAATDVAKEHKFFAIWNCEDRKSPWFMGAAA